VATLSPRFNPCSLEYHWHYLVYRNLFNVLEEIEFPYTAFLAPQFAVSARSPIAASIQPTVDYAIVVTLPPKDVAIPGWALVSAPSGWATITLHDGAPNRLVNLYWGRGGTPILEGLR